MRQAAPAPMAHKLQFYSRTLSLGMLDERREFSWCLHNKKTPTDVLSAGASCGENGYVCDLMAGCQKDSNGNHGDGDDYGGGFHGMV